MGAVIVNGDNVILGIGYNGFPRGCCDSDLPWSKVGMRGGRASGRAPGQGRGQGDMTGREGGGKQRKVGSCVEAIAGQGETATTDEPSLDLEGSVRNELSVPNCEDGGLRQWSADVKAGRCAVRSSVGGI